MKRRVLLHPHKRKRRTFYNKKRKLNPPLGKVEPKNIIESILGKRKFEDTIDINGVDNDEEYFDTHQPSKIFKGNDHSFVIQIY